MHLSGCWNHVAVPAGDTQVSAHRQNGHRLRKQEARTQSLTASFLKPQARLRDTNECQTPVAAISMRTRSPCR